MTTNEGSAPNNSNESSSLSKIVIIGAILALIGLGISTYSLMHHLELKESGVTQAACNINQTFSCDDVAASKYSEPFGVPMGIYGIAFFAGMLLLLMLGWFKEEFREDNLITYKVMTILGVVTSLVLLSISLADIGAVCLTCIGVYVVCFGQLGLLLVFRGDFPAGFPTKSIFNGSTYQVATLATGMILFSILKPPSQENFHPDLPQTEDPGAQTEPLVTQQPKMDIKINKNAYSGLGEDYRKGPDGAKAVIVEFADFECPACRDAYQTLKLLKKDMGDQVQIVFKNYPLHPDCNPGAPPLHEYACDAAVMARCAGRYGKFWPMHDLIFDNQSDLDRDRLTNWGKLVGLTDEQIKECRSSKDILAKIKDDINQGKKVGVQGTPSLYFNGRPLVGPRSFDALKTLVVKANNE